MNSKTKRHVLITGGAGYIGSHTAVGLLEAGYDVTIVDDLSNARADVIDRLEQLTGQRVPLWQLDVRDSATLGTVFAARKVDAVIHFAAKKAVGESATQPVQYCDVNIGGLLSVMSQMQAHDVSPLVFSSSATVYGMPEALPLREDAPRSFSNPYGFTKLVGEQILEQAQSDFTTSILRYFNPVGAHPSGLIGEDPLGIPNNLVPYIAKVARGDLPQVQVFGDDYDTLDGTGVRDYIHVCDLARGHVMALDQLFMTQESHVLNLGAGRGYSVREVIDTYSAIVGRPLPYTIAPRRVGDIATSYADPTRAQQVLGFRTTHDLEDMLRSSWAWIQSPHSARP